MLGLLQLLYCVDRHPRFAEKAYRLSKDEQQVRIGSFLIPGISVLFGISLDDQTGIGMFTRRETHSDVQQEERSSNRRERNVH